MNTKLEGLKSDNMEDSLNNFRKTICEIADGVLGKKVRAAARNICEKVLFNREEERIVQESFE